VEGLGYAAACNSSRTPSGASVPRPPQARPPRGSRRSVGSSSPSLHAGGP
jgi:hypothetical protein